MDPSHIILGIDEVGRGPWAGPLVVGAVILGENFPTDIQLTDSKKLTPKQRDKLYNLIKQHSLASATGWVSAAELDEIGLSASLKLATRRAVKPILHQLKSTTPSPKAPNFFEIIIDGTVNFLQSTPLENRVSTLKKADLLVKEVSAASIIAKVERDRYMSMLDTEYPGYGFSKHVGYGTAAHQSALLNLGPCSEHRFSFRPITKIANQFNITPEQIRQTSTIAPKTTSCQTPSAHPTGLDSNVTRGHLAESAVAFYLESQGHIIITRNFKTKTYEIDIISIKDNKIFFTEVKYRQNFQHGSALEQITPTKLSQMHYATEKFLNDHNKLTTSDELQTIKLNNLQPFLAVASVTGADYTVTEWFTIE